MRECGTKARRLSKARRFARAGRCQAARDEARVLELYNENGFEWIRLTFSGFVLSRGYRS